MTSSSERNPAATPLAAALAIVLGMAVAPGASLAQPGAEPRLPPASVLRVPPSSTPPSLPPPAGERGAADESGPARAGEPGPLAPPEPLPLSEPRLPPEPRLPLEPRLPPPSRLKVEPGRAAASPPPPAADAMRFSWHDGCGGDAAAGCLPTLLARGRIVPDTPARFEAAVAARPGRARVFLDSGGGDLGAALRLGTLIRRHRFDTIVGPVLPGGPGGPAGSSAALPADRAAVEGPGGGGDAPDAGNGTRNALPVCLSACAYAFLGGLRREVAQGARLGVHQFSSAQGGGTADESAVQRAVAALSAYMDAMGVDRRMLDLASATAPGSIRLIDPALARTLRIDNGTPALVAWQLTATDRGDPVVSVHQDLAPGKRLAVVLTRQPDGTPVAVVSLLLAAEVFGERLERFPVDRPAGAIEAALVTDAGRLPLAALFPWTRRATRGGVSFSTVFRLPEQAGATLRQARTLEFSVDFPRELADLDPSARLGTARLAQSMALLERSAAR